MIGAKFNVTLFNAPALFSRNQPSEDSRRSLLEPKDAVKEIRRQTPQNMTPST